MKDVDYIPFYEYPTIINENLSFYLEKYKFVFGKKNEFGIQLISKHVTIDIYFRYREFQLSFTNQIKVLDFNELIFIKYPNYIEMVKSNPETSIFKKQDLHKLNAHEDFKYCLLISFNFIEDNFPDIFKGDF